jgi:hypothetical protein
MPTTFRARLAAAASGFAGLVACSAGGPTITQEYLSDTYAASYLGHAQSRGGIALETAGSPFGETPSAFASRVAGIMDSAAFGREVDIVSAPGPEFASPYRLVMVFDGPAVTGEALCGGAPSDAAADASDGVRIAAAFCSGARRISSAVASTAPLAGPDDPAFAGALRSLGLVLFPPDSANEERYDMEWVEP